MTCRLDTIFYCVYMLCNFCTVGFLAMCSHDMTLANVVEGLRRLKSMGTPFCRPHDFMAEMLKSDKQMTRVSVNSVFSKFGMPNFALRCNATFRFEEGLQGNKRK